MKLEFAKAFGGGRNIRRVGMSTKDPLLLVDCIDDTLIEPSDGMEMVGAIDYGFYSPRKIWWVKFKTSEGVRYVYDILKFVCPCCGKKKNGHN